MQGYWKASVDGVEVGRGPDPEEALNMAVMAGHDRDIVIVEFMYDQPRAGSGIHRV